MYLQYSQYAPLLPKKDRFTIGTKIENQILDLLELAFLAHRKSGSSRLLILHKADDKIKLIQLLVRLAWEVKALKHQHYITLSEKLLEIGRVLGGWIKATQNPADKSGTV